MSAFSKSEVSQSFGAGCSHELMLVCTCQPHGNLFRDRYQLGKEIITYELKGKYYIYNFQAYTPNN